ncbi:MAG: nicotinate phosphoribosyltransferase [Treponema sp.]|nr:nicotinate phosphoribosyltransferase [Treponema sp.]
MAQGHWKRGRNRRASFEFFFRRQPFGGGYTVFAGLGTLLGNLSGFSFSDGDVEYLRSLGLFEDGFIEYLENFRFSCSLWAVDEGTLVFPHEPIIRVEGSIVECQLIEGVLLNAANFQSLIATKTRRVWFASGKGSVMEFGMRRAQGPDGAMSASRAAYIGGAEGTSNTLAGKVFRIPVVGTMAHSWVMSFAEEKDAFGAYADMYPDHCVFLIDTYNTLKNGIWNAIEVGKKLKKQGKTFGVRLDSGDIQHLSVEVRRRLDAAGLNRATIAVSGDLDESIVQTLANSGAPVDVWGVGTQMVTGGNDPAFSGVYKMTACEDAEGRMTQVMKFSDNPEKTTNPGIKQVWRIKDVRGTPLADVLALDAEDGSGERFEVGNRYRFWHPAADYRHFYHAIERPPEPLLRKRLDEGRLCGELPSLAEIRAKSLADFDAFDPTHKRHIAPPEYKVSISEKLCEAKLTLIKKHFGDLNRETAWSPGF